MVDDVFGIAGTVQAGTFRVDSAVAEGGFAVIYKAHHTGFRASIALKCLKIPGSMSPEDQKAFLSSFREEAELLFHLSSALPTVVRPLQVGTIESKVHPFVPFIALEWLEGTTLDHLIAERRERGDAPLPIAEAVKLLTPVAEALDKAHQFPAPGRDKKVCIVHRDLKPENIFVANMHGDQVAKILDFGIAKVKSAATQVIGRQSAKQDALVAFTPAYGSPEQWMPKRFGQTGPWTDVYGLAITLVEVVCGKCPIDGDQMEMMALALDVNHRPTPHAGGIDLPYEVESVFEKALAVDPQHRFHTMSDFWTSLTGALAGQSVKISLVPDLSLAPPRSDPVSPRKVTPAEESASSPAPTVVTPAAVTSAQRTPAQKPQPKPVGLGSGPHPAAVPRSPKLPTSHNYLLGKTIEGMEGDDDDDIPVAPAELQGVGLMPNSMPTPLRSRQRIDIQPQKQRKDLAQPITWLIASVGLMIADWAYTHFMGEPLAVGPVRMLWLAGPLALAGFTLLLVRVLATDD
jgi:serine/threonine-protein kinase